MVGQSCPIKDRSVAWLPILPQKIFVPKNTTNRLRIGFICSPEASNEHVVKRFLSPDMPYAVLDGVKQRLHLVQRIRQVRRRGGIVAVEDFVRGLGGFRRGLFETAS